jgi:polyisoprenoid-binding protein YceI
MRRLVAIVAAILAVSTAARAQSVWEIDPAHTSVQFSVRHMMVSNVRGEFRKVSGTVRADDKDLTKSVIEATIDTGSIDTREPKRDEHLKSPDFLDVAQYPTMTFKSKSITKAGEGQYKVTGDLTLHGVTHEVTLDVTGPTPAVKDPRGGMRAGAQATTKIDRQDYGVKWSKLMEGGGAVVGNEVSITIDAEGVKK